MPGKGVKPFTQVLHPWLARDPLRVAKQRTQGDPGTAIPPSSLRKATMRTPIFCLRASLALAALSTLPLLALPPKAEGCAVTSTHREADQVAALRAELADPALRLPLGLSAASTLASHLGLGVNVVTVTSAMGQATSSSQSYIRPSGTLNEAVINDLDARVLLYHDGCYTVLTPVELDEPGEAPQYLLPHRWGHEGYRTAEGAGPLDGDSLIRAMHQLAHKPVPEDETLAAHRAVLVALMSDEAVQREAAAPGLQGVEAEPEDHRLVHFVSGGAAVSHLLAAPAAMATARSSRASVAVGEADRFEDERQLAEALERSMDDYHQPSSSVAGAWDALLVDHDGQLAQENTPLEEDMDLQAALALSLASAQPDPGTVPSGASSYPPVHPRASSPIAYDGPCPMELDVPETPASKASASK